MYLLTIKVYCVFSILRYYFHYFDAYTLGAFWLSLVVNSHIVLRYFWTLSLLCWKPSWQTICLETVVVCQYHSYLSFEWLLPETAAFVLYSDLASEEFLLTTKTGGRSSHCGRAVFKICLTCMTVSSLAVPVIQVIAALDWQNCAAIWTLCVPVEIIGSKAGIQVEHVKDRKKMDGSKTSNQWGGAEKCSRTCCTSLFHSEFSFKLCSSATHCWIFAVACYKCSLSCCALECKPA